MKKNVLNILAGFVILTLLTFLKIYLNGNEEFSIAEELFSKNNYTEATTHYERAIQWHLPGSSTPALAAEKLWRISLLYESKNLTDEALKTCRLLRGAFYSTRSLFTPGKKWINLCNEKIAHWMASKPDLTNKTPLSFENRKNKFLKNLQADRPPSTFGSILTEVGFFGWVACAALFLLKAITPTAGLKPRPAIIYSAAFLIFYVIWILGMFTV
ncbi:MAG: hypothetical protein ACI8PD_001546 [Nitrospinales bacterium]|jgi:hypothetical protein